MLVDISEDLDLCMCVERTVFPFDDLKRYLLEETTNEWRQNHWTRDKKLPQNGKVLLKCGLLFSLFIYIYILLWVNDKCVAKMALSVFSSVNPLDICRKIKHFWHLFGAIQQKQVKIIVKWWQTETEWNEVTGWLCIVKHNWSPTYYFKWNQLMGNESHRNRMSVSV